MYPNLNKSSAPDLGAAALPREDCDAVAGDGGLSPDAGRGRPRRLPPHLLLRPRPAHEGDIIDYLYR